MIFDESISSLSRFITVKSSSILCHFSITDIDELYCKMVHSLTKIAAAIANINKRNKFAILRLLLYICWASGREAAGDASYLT